LSTVLLQTGVVSKIGRYAILGLPVFNQCSSGKNLKFCRSLFKRKNNNAAILISHFFIGV